MEQRRPSDQHRHRGAAGDELLRAVGPRLTDWQPSYTYLWDFLSLWGLFVVFMLVFRVLTDKLSHVKVKFLKLADRIGSGVLSLWIGWVMVMFTMTTLHTAPLAKVFMFEGFQPEEKMFFGLAPDHQWLAFTQKMSRGRSPARRRTSSIPTRSSSPSTSGVRRGPRRAGGKVQHLAEGAVKDFP